MAKIITRLATKTALAKLIISKMLTYRHMARYNRKYKNKHSVGLGLEAEVSNLTPSVGVSYSTQEKYPRAQNPLDPDLGRVGIGAGLKLRASDSVSIETGSATYIFITDRMLFKSIKMNKTAWTWGVGVTLKAL